MNDKLIKSSTGEIIESIEDLLALGSTEDIGEIMGEFEQTVFCLDLSSSMRENLDEASAYDPDADLKIDLLKKALERYIKNRFQKNPLSRVGLVGFHTSAQVIIPITDCERELLDEAENLESFGSTRMDLGLEESLRLIKDISQSWIPRIVLISDGAPDSQTAVIEVLDRYSGTRVTIDSIYIGKGGYKPFLNFMESLAQRTGGTFESITSIHEFEKKFLKVADRFLLSAGNI